MNRKLLNIHMRMNQDRLKKYIKHRPRPHLVKLLPAVLARLLEPLKSGDK